MSGFNEATTESGDAPGTPASNAWSLLYPGQPELQPMECPDCGNVFATDSTSCPWCGRIVSAATEASTNGQGPREPRQLDQSGASHDLATAMPEYGGAAAGEAGARTTGSAGTDPATAGLRRWTSLLLAGSVLLVIATGLTIRARNNRNADKASAGAITTSVKQTTLPSTASSTSSASTASTTGSTTAITVASTTAVSSSVATTASTVAPVTTASTATTAPTTAPTTPTTTAPSTTPTTTSAPTFSAEQTQAIELAQSLSDALANHNWSRARELTKATGVTDEQFSFAYGSLRSTSVVPARVEKRADGSYDVYAGVIQVKRESNGDTSSLWCNRYTVNLVDKTVGGIKSTANPLRVSNGVIPPSTVTDELRAACASPTLG